jgi:hypothetical protein
MRFSRPVLIGFLVCTILALGVAMANRAKQPSDRERLSKLVADGNFKDA